MPHFFFRLIPPRPTFAVDMSDDERALMAQHAAYMRDFFDAGTLLAYGPVLDAEGSFGMGVLEMKDQAEAEQFAADDPTVKAGMNTFTISPMHLAGLRVAPARPG